MNQEDIQPGVVRQYDQVPVHVVGSPMSLESSMGERLRVVGTIEARAKLWAELAMAIAEFPPIPKNKHVKFYSKKVGGFIEYDYSTYAAIRSAVDAPLGKHGIVAMSFPHEGPDYVVTTLLAGHGAEVWATLVCPLPDGMDIKVLGGLFTYLRRYGLQQVLCREGDVDADDLPDDELPVQNQGQRLPAPDKKPARREERQEERSEPPKRQAAKQTPKKPSDLPVADQLATKEQLDPLADLVMASGLANNPKKLQARVREILGYEPHRNAQGRGQYTVREVGLLIAGFRDGELPLQEEEEEEEAES
jgi:hypothetical protein